MRRWMTGRGASWRWARRADPDNAGHLDAKARRRMRDAFVYFDNGAKVRAPVDDVGLMRRVEGITRDLS